MEDARLAEIVQEVLRSEGESPKLRQICQRSSCGASPDQRLFRKLWVVFVWSPLFSCSRALLLLSPRLSRALSSTWTIAQRVCKIREMVLLVTRLLHFVRRDKELRQLTTLLSSADHASSDGNSRRILRQLRSGRPSKLCIGVFPNLSTPWSSPVC